MFEKGDADLESLKKGMVKAIPKSIIAVPLFKCSNSGSCFHKDIKLQGCVKFCKLFRLGSIRVHFFHNLLIFPGRKRNFSCEASFLRI